MSQQTYEYKVVNLSKSDKEMGYTSLLLNKRSETAIEKMSAEGWELTNITSDFMGHPKVLTFRREKLT